MLDYQSYPQFNIVESIREVASVHLKNLDWRKINDGLCQQIKDPADAYSWWYSRTSKDNKVFHNSNIGCLLEDTEYATGSGHFNIEVTRNRIFELNMFDDLIPKLSFLAYAGIFFIGPNSDVEEHSDNDQYNILINIKVPNDAFLTIENKKFYLKENEIFMFDGDLKHSASNQSDQDWILVALRINKQELHI